MLHGAESVLESKPQDFSAKADPTSDLYMAMQRFQTYISEVVKERNCLDKW